MENTKINPHWDKCLAKFNLSDECLETINRLLFDSNKNYMNLLDDNKKLKYRIDLIKKQIKEI